MGLGKEPHLSPEEIENAFGSTNELQENLDKLPESLKKFFNHDAYKLADNPNQRERPVHRVIMFLAAQGMSNVEIAFKVGVTPTTVSRLMRQPWFKKRVVDIVNSQGLDPVKEIIRGAALDSVYKIIELRDKASSENVQMKSAFDLLDRYLGKSVQPVAEDKVSISDEARLDAEIAELQKQVAKN